MSESNDELGPKVLFVDDEPAILSTLKVILENEGFQVVAVSNVSDAITAIGKEKFDILLSDLNIGQPGDGFTVVSAMKRVQPKAKTIIITGYPDFQSALTCIRSQVDDFVTKPANVPALIKLVRTHLSRPCDAPSFPQKRVSDVIDTEKARIVSLWLEMITSNKLLSEVEIPREDRCFRAELALDKLIQRLRLKNSESVDPASAMERGRARKAQGYTIQMLVEETRLIQFSVFAVLQDDLLLLDTSLIIPDMITIADFFQERLRIAIDAFQEDIPLSSNSAA